MALWDTADLLDRVKRLTARNKLQSDPAMAAADWYAFLTEGQAHWMREIAAHVPEVLYCPPTLLVSADSGETYQFPNYHWFDASLSGNAKAASVFACELYDRKDGRLLIPGSYYSRSADYVFEGNRIRFPAGQLKTFTSGPYARYVAEPLHIGVSTVSGIPPFTGSDGEPVLRPASARMLIVARAAALWADRGGKRDPAPFYELENRIYYGDPARGMIGILASLKAGDHFGGLQAIEDESFGGAWWYGIDPGGWIP